MSSFAAFVQRLLAHGDVALSGPPPHGPAEDAAAGPVLASAFADHALDVAGPAGLHLLYAERLVGRERPAWVPPGGPARERAELVFRGRGRSLPAPPREEPSRE